MISLWVFYGKNHKKETLNHYIVMELIYSDKQLTYDAAQVPITLQPSYCVKHKSKTTSYFKRGEMSGDLWGQSTGIVRCCVAASTIRGGLEALKRDHWW